MYSEAQWQKIAGPRATFISADLAREILDGRSEARIYGLAETGPIAGQIVRIYVAENLDRDDMRDLTRLWVSGVTVADMIRRA